MWVQYKNSSTGGSFASCRFYIYTTWDQLLPCPNPPSPPAPRRLTRPARALGDWRLIRLAAVSTKMGRNTPLLCVVTVNTTLSGGGQPPPLRKPTRLVGIMSLANGLLCFSVSKIALSSDIDKRIVYRIFFRYPLSDSGTAYSGRLPTLEPALNVGYLQLVICRGSGK